MPNDSYSQGIARGITNRITPGQTSVNLSQPEFAVVTGILSDLTKSLGNAPGQINLGEVQTRTLKAVLDEYIKIPTDP